jgi:uncharacterized protein YycO
VRLGIQVAQGSVGVTRGTHLVDRVIQWGTSGRYNHAGVVVGLDEPTGWPLMVEASPEGATVGPVNPARFVFDAYALTRDQRMVVAASAWACVGLPYDWRDIGRFIWRWRQARRTGSMPDFSDDRVICSEICAWALGRAGVDVKPGVAPGAVSPNDLADHMLRYAGHSFTAPPGMMAR